jgi:hypothetical protein
MRRSFFFAFLILIPLALRADLLFWLDSPSGRSNPFDPKYSGPHSVNSMPIPTPVAGLTVRIKEAGAAAIPGAVVMLGNSTATVQVTDATGKAFFLGAMPPQDVHVFAPPGQPQWAPAIVSCLGVPVSDVTLDAFINTLTAVIPLTITVRVTTTGSPFVGGAGADAVVWPQAASFPVFQFGAGSSTFTYPYSSYTGDSVYYSGAEVSILGSFTGAFFNPPQALSAPVTALSGIAVASGYSTASPALALSDAGAWGSGIMALYAGTAPGAAWYCPSLNVQFSVTVTAAGPWLYPSSPSYFEASFAGFTTTASGEFQSGVGYLSGTAMPATIAIKLPGRLSWTQTPSGSNIHPIVANSLDEDGDGWVVTMGHQDSSGATISDWSVFKYGATQAVAFNAAMPTTFPVAVGAPAIFPVGKTLTANAYVSKSLTAFDPSRPLPGLNLTQERFRSSAYRSY